MTETSFGPVGRCIYCDSSSRVLTREHIVPYGLGGDKTLLDAVCKPCAAATTSIEGYFLNNFLKGPRALLRMPSRKGHPKNLTIETPTTRVSLPIKIYPSIMFLPIMSPPGFLTGRNEPRVQKMWLASLQL
jgi:hypothetical protein